MPKLSPAEQVLDDMAQSFFIEAYAVATPERTGYRLEHFRFATSLEEVEDSLLRISAVFLKTAGFDLCPFCNSWIRETCQPCISLFLKGSRRAQP